MARLLVASGADDQPWQTVTRAGTVSLRGPSLFALAALVAAETDAGGLRWAKYRPHPRTVIAPALDDVLAAVKAGRIPSRARGRSGVPALGVTAASV